MSKRKPTPRPRRKKPAAPAEPTTGETGLPQSNPKGKPFLPENLDRTVIAIPLLKTLRDEEEADNIGAPKAPKVHSIVIDLNLEFPGGREQARQWIVEKIKALIGGAKGAAAGRQELKSRGGPKQQYVFAALTGETIRELVRQDGDPKDPLKKEILEGKPHARAIYHIWPNFEIKALINRSLSTVKADAAHASFAALGGNIVWAVLDSGIDRKHLHFKLHENLELAPPLEHMDFTGGGLPDGDPFGHGTHVAGIIAGEFAAARRGRKEVRAYMQHRDERGDPTAQTVPLKAISGMAPKCKLLNMRVLNDEGGGEMGYILDAIDKIQELNDYGRKLLVHGVNISVGYEFDPEWFACGQSPLCVEVNRLVQSGVVVVVAAGNSGYGTLDTEYKGVISAGMSLTINDPGNAEHAITVGSTHRYMPHAYGVSYFSSKGPTGDGRLKPDLIAPGEKIISCAAGAKRDKAKGCDYCEDSGTSMAAPHVSGVIAAFLSIRPEFVGQPERVKRIFLSTATDLQRERYFQGHGLVDLMRAIQSV